MKFEFTGRHIEVTPALKAHVEEQFAKVEHLFEGTPALAHVIIEVERGRHRSEVVINWRNEVLTADSSAADMYLSLSQSVNKIGKQAKKLRDKVIDKSHKAKKAAAIITPAEPSAPAPLGPNIIQSDGFLDKPMTPDEAVIELENGQKSFVIFRNSDGGKAAVIFRRDDGNYGLAQA